LRLLPCSVPTMSSLLRVGWAARPCRSGRRLLEQQHRQKRLLTTTPPSQTFSSLEYPLATEAPVVTQTTAKEAAKQETLTKPRRPDDAEFSEIEIEHSRKLQREHLPTSLQDHFEWSKQPISKEIPSGIPPNVESSSLEIPETHLTLLANGIRVVSQETYGQVCTVGVLGDFGSRQETVLGTSHLVEVLGFSATRANPDSNVIQENLQDWGATSFVNSGREQTLWCLDVLRPNVHRAMELLQQVSLEPLLREHDLEQAKQTIFYQAQDTPPELLVSEAIQQAAYGEDQQLGKPHFCPIGAISSLTPGAARDYLESQLWNNPERVVVAGAGIGHEELVDMAQHHFGHLTQSTPNKTVLSQYRGGGYTAVPATPTIDGLTRVAVALEVGGWHSDDLVPACVLQTLLGGGNSFSAGGPGKGMYSRLYQQVLNRYHWAESAEAFTSFHGESGLLGISGSSKPARSRDLVGVFSKHLLRLGDQQVSDEELNRARNMLKCNVLTQLESRLVLFEDMGRQILTFGKREDNATMCKKIDAVTKEDLQELVQRALQKPPTVCAVGDNVSLVPSHADVVGWFGSKAASSS